MNRAEVEAKLRDYNPAQREDLYKEFCRAYILSRGHLSSQNYNWRIIEGMAKLWNLSPQIRRLWYKEQARKLDQTIQFVERHIGTQRKAD